MVRRYTDGYRKTDEELQMESTNYTELEQVITRCLKTTVKNEWAKLAKMEKRLKGKRILLLWWLLPFLTNKTKLFAFAFFQTFWLLKCFVGSFYYICKEVWKCKGKIFDWPNWISNLLRTLELATKWLNSFTNS